MMTKQKIVDSRAAPNTGSYSPALKVGPWIIVSGQGPIDATGAVVPGDITEQTILTMENIRRLVESAGGSMDQVVKCTCYLARIEDFAEFDDAYRRFFNGTLPLPHHDRMRPRRHHGRDRRHGLRRVTR